MARFNICAGTTKSTPQETSKLQKKSSVSRQIVSSVFAAKMAATEAVYGWASEIIAFPVRASSHLDKLIWKRPLEGVKVEATTQQVVQGIWQTFGDIWWNFLPQF